MKIGIVGLGYVGLPLAVAFAEAGHDVIGLDTDARKLAAVGEGRSYIEDVPSERLQALDGRLRPTGRYAELSKADAVVIAVPTPLTDGMPDLAMVRNACAAVAEALGHGAMHVVGGRTRPQGRPCRLEVLLVRLQHPRDLRIRRAQRA